MLERVRANLLQDCSVTLPHFIVAVVLQEMAAEARNITCLAYSGHWSRNYLSTGRFLSIGCLSDKLKRHSITNPTVAVLEQRIAALEGGSGAICTASGRSV